ncbi:hypothetical protein O6P43_004877 [Quillaja saponaria]|uniref:Uncharacterized protein n=1 Tax=Quillaja saponaria TaxID=32244 RepID=A0AAD7VGP5_QUISA|nr:hypothetical protein O6P43_004877 [Quillaja saponaria]
MIMVEILNFDAMQEDPPSPKTPERAEFRLPHTPKDPPPRPTPRYKPTDFTLKILMNSVYSLDPEFQKKFHSQWKAVLKTPATIAAEKKRKLKTLKSLRNLNMEKYFRGCLK